MVFQVQAYRVFFRALDRVYFPAGKFTNIFRGEFGIRSKRLACMPGCESPRSCSQASECPYARLFEPSIEMSKALADVPRPFVLRGPTLEEMRLEAGHSFWLDLHLFDLTFPALRFWHAVLSDFARQGIGPSSGRLELMSIRRIQANGRSGDEIASGREVDERAEQCPLELSLEPRTVGIRKMQLRFYTPTEFKDKSPGGLPGVVRVPVFSLLMKSARQRLVNLRAAYQGERLRIDFAGMDERAAAIRAAGSRVFEMDFERLSTRTGHRHELGGFVGTADYDGNLDEFIPIFEAARWTGIGRQTAWGFGAVETLY